MEANGRGGEWYISYTELSNFDKAGHLKKRTCQASGHCQARPEGQDLKR